MNLRSVSSLFALLAVVAACWPRKCGEGLWRYQELERTRGYRDNTTTFLMCCKKCQGWLKATVDHDD